MAKQDLVEITCYGQTKIWERKKAKAFFLDCMNNSEGSENERYTTIYCALMNGETKISDRCY